MIAITGGNGLLGSFIVRKLLDQNETFVALKRSNSDTSLLADVSHKIQWRVADVLDPISLEEAFQGVTHVIHAAAMVSFSRHATSIHQINVQGTRHVVNACLTSHVKRLVHISSVAALGRLKESKHIDEQSKWTENSQNSTYAETKYLAELEVFRGEEEGLNTVILNPSVILAPADWTRSSAKLFKYVWDEKLFYTDTWLNYVDVRDVADITWQLLHSDISGERFVVNAGNIALKEFLGKTAVRFQKRAPFIQLNQSMLKLAAIGEAVRAWLSRREPLITKETARLAGTRFFYDSGKLKKQLRFEFQTIDETLEWCCKYYLDKLSAKK
jgi:dihydroflavonol-4-reductase